MADRYELWTYYGDLQEDKQDNGDWVKYEDHAAELAALRAENAALKEKLERIAGTSGLSRDAEICRTIAKEALK